MKIPQQIELNIINPEYVTIEKEFLLGLKIFELDGSYHNYSLIKTNSDGKIVIQQSEIIENTELKHKDKIAEFKPQKIEFYIWDCKTVSSILNYYKNTENLLNQENINQIITKNFVRKGFSENEAKKYVEMTKIQLSESLNEYNKIKNVENCNYEIVTQFIEDNWNDDSIKKYKLIVK